LLVGERKGIGGWLLLLILLLVVWGPLSLALVVSGALSALPVRGVPLGILLVWRVLVTAFGIAAGMALASQHAVAVRMATAALLLSAATDLIVYLTPYFPSNRMPGDTPIYVAASLMYHGVWIAYLLRSTRVRHTYE
jgi:hypothetical protein